MSLIRRLKSTKISLDFKQDEMDERKTVVLANPQLKEQGEQVWILKKKKFGFLTM